VGVKNNWSTLIHTWFVWTFLPRENPNPNPDFVSPFVFLLFFSLWFSFAYESDLRTQGRSCTADIGRSSCFPFLLPGMALKN
jgi:hypothetical protein